MSTFWKAICTLLMVGVTLCYCIAKLNSYTMEIDAFYE